MIPIGDEGTPIQRGLPIVNLALIGVNIVVFLFQLATGLDNGPITMGWSLVPREISSGYDIIGSLPDFAGITYYAAPLGIPWLTFLTSMFMHGGWLHIGSNMLFLFIFGDNVEDNMGSVKYLIFYLLCGFAADFTQYFMGGTTSPVPNLGASGAIAGVLGAYLILFPQAKVRSLILLGFFATIARVPALIMIGLWIATQFISVFLAQEQAAGGGGGVAYWAHVGGFIAGVLLLFVFRGRSNQSTPAYST